MSAPKRNRKCVYIHPEPRDIVDGRCKWCTALSKKENKERIRIYDAKHNVLYKERRKELDAKRYQENTEEMRAKSRERHSRNKERDSKNSALHHENNKEWINFRHKVVNLAFPWRNSARSRKRDADRVKATPVWSDTKAINFIYKQCEETSKETGVKHHVDHIVPLRGKTVCGLHVPWNLQVIPAIENMKKHTKLIPELLETLQ